MLLGKLGADNYAALNKRIFRAAGFFPLFCYVDYRLDILIFGFNNRDLGLGEERKFNLAGNDSCRKLIRRRI